MESVLRQGVGQYETRTMRITLATHVVLLVALLASPVGASAQSATEVQELEGWPCAR